MELYCCLTIEPNDIAVIIKSILFVHLLHFVMHGAALFRPNAKRIKNAPLNWSFSRIMVIYQTCLLYSIFNWSAICYLTINVIGVHVASMHIHLHSGVVWVCLWHWAWWLFVILNWVYPLSLGRQSLQIFLVHTWAMSILIWNYTSCLLRMKYWEYWACFWQASYYLQMLVVLEKDL